MFVHLRMTAPPSLTAPVLDVLTDDRVFAVTLVRGASIDPAGDLIECDVAREAANDVLGQLRLTGIDQQGSITVVDAPLALSQAGQQAERAAVGSPTDSVIWAEVLDGARSALRPTFSYHAFLLLATMLAGIAVITDSPVLVVGAMVVGPEFGLVAAACVFLAFGMWRRALHAVAAVVASFTMMITAVAIVSLLGVWLGWFDASTITRPRPMTTFIWHPDRWSLMVALLAGAAGALAITTGKSDAMVGVFISVTTVPAAGNLALAMATWAPTEVRGSALQLLLNITGMVLAGTVVVLAQRVLWRRVGHLPRAHSQNRRSVVGGT